jgi:hypothetical protein
MQDPAWDATRLALAISEGTNILGVIAAPRVFSRLNDQLGSEMKQEIQRAMSELLEGAKVQSTPPLPPAFVTDVATFAQLIADWDGKSAPSSVMVAAARQALASFGVPTPPDGWDNFNPAE